MDEANAKKWDTIIKGVGLVSLLLSGGFAIYKLQVDRKVDLEHRAQELNRYVFERQTNLYFETAKVAAVLARGGDPKTVEPAKQRFYELYLGELVIVEDRRVELAMITFERCLTASNAARDCIRETVNEEGKPIAEQVLQRLGEPSLFNFSLELSACLRTALEKNRGIQFTHRVPAQTICPYD